MYKVVSHTDEYHTAWRIVGLEESQSAFHFVGTCDMNEVRRILSDGLNLSVLDGVDPVPTNIVASGTCAPRGAATGAACLLRLEVNPNHTRAEPLLRGPGRAAARLTIRSERCVARTIVSALAAVLGGVTPL